MPGVPSGDHGNWKNNRYVIDCKMSLYANGSFDEHAVYIRR